VDTGSFAANHAWHIGLEGIWQDGPLSVMGEYIHAKTDAPLSGSPSFQGGYIGASWVVTGDARPYDPNVGYARRVKPGGTHGAIELVARLFLRRSG
jgi:phosphate-selective porin OprO/OprP